MVNSKLVRLIGSLSKFEMQELKSFLASPFFNSNPKIIAFYKFLAKAYPNFEKKNISKVAAYKFVYPDKEFNDNSFRNLILDFSKLIIEFLNQLELRQKPALKNQLSLESFSKRLLKRDFENLYFKIQNNQIKNPPKDSKQFFDQYNILKTYYHYPETNRIEIDHTYFSKVLFNLNQFFVLSKLTLAIEVASRKDLLKENTPAFFFKENIYSYYSSLTKVNSQPLVNLLIKLEHFYNDPTAENIDITIKLFKAQYTKLSPFDKKMVVTVLINQMNYLFRQGQIKYLNKIFKLYKFSLTKNILTYNNSLSTSEYLNIVTTASRNKKTAWAFSFIDESKHYLPKKEKKQVVALAKATVQYDNGQYNLVSDLLAPFSFRNSPLGLRFRFITVKAYVELVFRDSIKLEFVQNFVTRMDQYVKRAAKKRNTDQTEGFINFLEIVQLILKASTNKNKKELKKIQRLVQTQHPLIAKKWLLQKAKYLE